MTTPCSGQLNWSDVNAELGHAWNAAMDINYGPVRTLAGRPGSGNPISFADLRCKSWYKREPSSGYIYNNQNFWRVGYRGGADYIGISVYWGGVLQYQGYPGDDRDTVTHVVSGDGWNYHRGGRTSNQAPYYWYELFRERWG